jgi:mono/diheme cytochrome c family protein
MRHRLIGQSLAASVFAVGLFSNSRSIAASTTEPATGPQATMTKECGACHMVFPPQFLPARSWAALMDGLANHFGETATLDAAIVKEVAEYLATHAADAPSGDKRYLRGLKATETPLRITETPYWIRKHTGEVSPSTFSNPKVKSKANCVACHRDAAQGNFGDD